MERGKKLERALDRGVGIPLAFAAGGAMRTLRAFVPPHPAPEEVKSVGVLCLGAIGDLLLLTALLSGLRRELPHARIEVITSKANAACRGMVPHGIESSSFAVRDIPGMFAHIRRATFDLFIDAGQWARISALLTAFSGAGRTVGFRTPGQYRHYAFDHAVDHRNDRHEVENFLALGRAVFPALSGEPEIAVPEALPAAADFPLEKTVFCHMWPSGLKSQLKEWPAAYWAELAASLISAGYRVAFTGGGQDVAATENFLGANFPGNDAAFSLAGKTGLPELARLMAGAAGVVSVNTGIMHLAAIAGAPTIALNGPTNPLRWGPVGPKVAALLPNEGRFAYLNLGFEYGDATEPVLKHLPVASVMSALARFGVAIS